MIEELTGVVLAGGRSSRFGADKALADWGGATMVEAVIGALLQVLPKVLVVTKKPSELAFLNNARVQVIEDLHRDSHPMGGLLTALRRLDTAHAFVAGCDMPFVRPELIETLWRARADYDAVIPVWGDKRQPLCGIYTRGCAVALRASIERDELGIFKLFDSLRTRFVLEGEVRDADPEGLSFTDIDTRDDYLRVRGSLPC